MEIHLNQIYAAIADPTRRAILARLTQGEARGTELAKPFSISLNTVSKYVRVLEQGGFVRRPVRGRDHSFALEAEPLRAASAWIDTYQPFWEERLDAVDSALDGLTDADLTKRPSDHVNPIGWLLWHTYRVEDRYFSEIAGAPQSWITDKWHEKFGMVADPAQIGIGNSMEQVTTFKPTLSHLQGYRAAVRQQTLRTLENLTPEDGHSYKIGRFLGALLYNQFHYSGQICYLRGLVSQDWSLGLWASNPGWPTKRSARGAVGSVRTMPIKQVD